MKKLELLAPAGNMKGLKSAILAGADAVYIGGYVYSARGYADNFSNEEIIEAINYAHLYGVKIYVAVNTLVYDSEVETFMNYIDFLHKNNVDAIIIQDLGMLDLAHKTYPNLEIHASTQMHIHNIEGVKFAKKVGIKRVVLAREVSIDSIKEIKKQVDIDLEVFCHGALCVSYSGQCLMSSLIGGRSGNRGVCAGTCRLPYDLVTLKDNKQTVLNQDKYLLSMKDLNTLEHIDKLIEAGVSSLKIEGRMKREEYIYLVVSIYRRAIDNYYATSKLSISNKDIIELKKIYNRMFTKGYLFNEENNKVINQYRPNHHGIKIGTVIKRIKDEVFIKLTDTIRQGDGIRILNKKSDVGLQLNNFYSNKKLIKEASSNAIISFKINDNVDIGDIVLKTSDIKQIQDITDKLKQDIRKVKIKGYFEAKIGHKMCLKITDSKNTIIAECDHDVEMAKTNPVSAEQIRKQLNKLGNTIYEFSELELNIDNDIFISIKDINDLRRNAISNLNNERLYKTRYIKCDYKIDIGNFPKEKNLNYLINSEKQYIRIKDKNIKTIYTDNLELFNKIKNDTRVIYKLPRVINNFNNYKGDLLVGELGSINYYNNNLMTDFSLNVTNSYTVAFLHSLGIKKITLSYELDIKQIKEIVNNYKSRYKSIPNLEVIIYGYEEMMISKFKLLSFYKQNSDNIYLKDRYQKLYRVKENNNLLYIYNNKPRNDLKNANLYYDLGINNIRINILDDDELEKNLLI